MKYGIFLIFLFICWIPIPGNSAELFCIDTDTQITLGILRNSFYPSNTLDREGLLWSYTGDDNAACIRSIPDVNGDGFPDVVTGYDIFQDNENFYCFSGASSGTGTVIWSIETTGGASGGYFYGDECLEPAYDSDGNGYPNILAGLAGGGRFAASYDCSDGSLIWQFDTYNEPQSGWVYSIKELGDVTGDGIPEVIFGCGSYNDHAYCIDGSSTGTSPTVLWSASLPDASFSVSPISDVNNDGLPDAMISCGDPDGQYVYCVEGDSNSTANILWTFDAGYSIHTIIPCSDINGNGGEDFIVGTWGAGVLCGDGKTAGTHWSNPFGANYIMLIRPLQDINGDGLKDILVGSWDNTIACLNGLNGNTLWSTPTGSLNGGDVWTIHAIADVDGDGYEDVIAGSFDTNVYCVSGIDGSVLWTYGTSNRVLSVFPSEDIDDDDIPDALAGTQNTVNNIVVFALSGEIPVITPTQTPYPTTVPTDTPPPTHTPTELPTDTPTTQPTNTPTNPPTNTPTDLPTESPTDTPTPFTSPTGTPTCPPSGVFLSLSADHFYPGNQFLLEAQVCNGERDVSLDFLLFIMLDVYGDYFFYPSWGTVLDYASLSQPPCSCSNYVIFDFMWPDTGSEASGIILWAAVTDEFFNLIGSYDYVEFGWS
ncbi:VCBS repeat-containing protein [bacterium]|nr:VCBS repeat-containing protein [candidate division CSSED10-310 bacterium]